MFPYIRCNFSGFQEAFLGQKFAIILDMVPYDNKRYQYVYHRFSWLVAGKADPPPPKSQYLHPDSPFSIQRSDQILSVSFEKVKLANSEANKSDEQIMLNYWQKFQPRIHLALVDDSWNCSYGTPDLHKVKHKTFSFELTSFIAVNAYQNQLISMCKISM